MMDLNRRRVLRGMLSGSAVTVGLPLLNVFLNGNGTAMADGAPLPVRFGTWAWGLGMDENGPVEVRPPHLGGVAQPTLEVVRPVVQRTAKQS